MSFIKSLTARFTHNPSRPCLPLQTQAIRFIPVFVASSFILAAALLVANARMPDPNLVRPLPDVGFNLLPKVAFMEKLTDLCIAVLCMINTLLMFKLYLLHLETKDERKFFSETSRFKALNQFLFRVWDRTDVCSIKKHNVHLIAWIRFLTTYSILLLFRSVVIIMTSYPATDNHCQEPRSIDNPVKNIFLTVVTLGSGSIHCGDLMFSGHTIIITLNIMLSWCYGPVVHMIFRPLTVGISLFSFYCIIASRSHYTDDVLVAFYLTASTFVAIPHTPDGAPWQLQLLICWWPCCSANSVSVESSEQAVIVVCEVSTPHSVLDEKKEEKIEEKMQSL